MRKRELVHFHALLDQIRWFAAERGDLPDDALEAYETLDVAPTAVYRSKQDHEDAVVTLTESLAEAVDEPDRPTDSGDSDAHDDTPARAHSD
jgi:hypothetical protein